jgi:hypothetical protein
LRRTAERLRARRRRGREGVWMGVDVVDSRRDLARLDTRLRNGRRISGDRVRGLLLRECVRDPAVDGRPLALVPGADRLNEFQMRAIAREFNQSETTFLLRPTRPGATYRLRSSPRPAPRSAARAIMRWARGCRWTPPVAFRTGDLTSGRRSQARSCRWRSSANPGRPVVRVDGPVAAALRCPSRRSRRASCGARPGPG